MKKILLISLVTVLAVGLVGCMNNETIDTNNPNGVVESGDNLGDVTENENEGNESVESEDNKEPEVEEVKPEDNKEPEVEEVKPEDNKEPENEVVEPEDNITENGEPVVDEENNEEVEEEIEEEYVPSPLEAKITNIVETAGVMMRMPMAMPITAETAVTFIGLSEADFAANIKDAIAFESMISPANSSVCLLELNDTADVAKVKKLVIDNCDPNKWICMSADKCMVVDSGRYIVLVMSTAEECDAVQKVFASEFGATGEVLTK